MKSVYLAGPIKGLSYGGASDWREDVSQRLAERGIKGLSPMRAKDYLRHETTLGAEYKDSVMSCAKGITARDRNDVYSCDLVLANLAGADTASLGTAVEFGWADAWRKPVVMVATEDDAHYHAMLIQIAGFIVPTLSDALNVVFAVLDAPGSYTAHLKES